MRTSCCFDAMVQVTFVQTLLYGTKTTFSFRFWNKLLLNVWTTKTLGILPQKINDVILRKLSFITWGIRHLWFLIISVTKYINLFNAFISRKYRLQLLQSQLFDLLQIFFGYLTNQAVGDACSYLLFNLRLFKE